MSSRLIMTTCGLTCGLAAAVLLNGSNVLADTQQTFHIAPHGSDENPGSEARPFASIEKARDAVRAINGDMTGDIAVVLHGGTYYLRETVRFDARDSGTGGHDVIYRAWEGHEVVLSGGKVITGWQSDVNGRWKAPCGEHFRQLYVDGQRAVRARSEETKGKTAKWYQLDIIPVPGFEHFGDNGYRTANAEMADWHNPQDVELCYYIGWCHTRCKVDGIVRAGPQAVIRMVQPQFMLARRKEGLRADLPNYIENALELLDRPGEWYLDRSSSTLYYRPRRGENMDEVEVIAAVLERLVELRGRGIGQSDSIARCSADPNAGSKGCPTANLRLVIPGWPATRFVRCTA